MNNLSITNISKLFRKVIENIHFVVFVTIIAGALIGCLFTLVSIVYMSYDVINPSINMSDQTTINILNTYETSLRNSSYKAMPVGKVNPFNEQLAQ